MVIPERSRIEALYVKEPQNVENESSKIVQKLRSFKTMTQICSWILSKNEKRSGGEIIGG